MTPDALAAIETALAAMGHTVKGIRDGGDLLRVDLARYRGGPDAWVEIPHASTKGNVAEFVIETLDGMQRYRAALNRVA